MSQRLAELRRPIGALCPRNLRRVDAVLARMRAEDIEMAETIAALEAVAEVSLQQCRCPLERPHLPEGVLEEWHFCREDPLLHMCNADEREAELTCRLIGGWRLLRTPPEEIERQIAAMSERELETFEAVTAGMAVAQRLDLAGVLAEARLRSTPPAGRA